MSLHTIVIRMNSISNNSFMICVPDCEFVCHARCLSQITRVCVHVAVSERPEFELRICPEVGLSAAQNFRCAECKNHITFKMCSHFSVRLLNLRGRIVFEHSWVEPRLCDYSGHYFCPNCHWNTSAVIPARVVHNWDFEPKRISRAARQLLKLMMNKPVLLLKEINPQLFALVEELSLVQGLREELLLMKRYLVECKSAGEQRLLWLLRSRQHFVESAHLYSLQDLIDINTGELLPFISKVHEIYLNHIKEECKLCFGRGYLCELCDDSQVIFPFDSAALSCEVCSNVFHRSCWAKRSPQHCPRCIRLSERAARLSMNLDDYDSENTAND
ncbi:hypothetical protein B566_EDAN002981 [Ephemera danica]|nr:hypothetical protein B566_EDAN002981 [Ephemera danica]